jgi:Flp pilus assembly protein CpaB
MSHSVRQLAIAALLATVAGVLVVLYTGRAAAPAGVGGDTVGVVVAARDVAAGTSVAEAIAAGDLTVARVPADVAIPGSFTALERVNGQLVLAQPAFEGAQLTGGMLRESTRVRVTSQIGGRMRAHQISIGKDAALVGTLQAGDRVDLVGTYHVETAGGSGTVVVSRIIAEDVRVLSTSGSGIAAAHLAGADADGGRVLLELADDVVPKVTLTLEAGKLWVVARPADGAAERSQPYVATLPRVLLDGLTSGERAQMLDHLAGREATQ